MGTSNSEKIKAGDSVRIENASGYSEVYKVKMCGGSPVAISPCKVFQFHLDDIDKTRYSVVKV